MAFFGLRFLIPVAIALSLSILSFFIEKKNDEKLLRNLDTDHIVLKMPKIYIIVGICDIVFCSIMFCFPNETATIGVYILFSCFTALGMFIVTSVLIWKMEVFKDKPYFIYRTVFGHIFRVEYAECEWYKQTKNTLIIKTKKRTLYIDNKTVNFGFLPSIMRRHNVREILQGHE